MHWQFSKLNFFSVTRLLFTLCFGRVVVVVMSGNIMWGRVVVVACFAVVPVTVGRVMK